MTITYCIPTKNNLRYLKSSIESIRNNSSIPHQIIVYIDSDNDGTEEWLIANNVQYIKNGSSIPKGIAFGYNECIRLSTTEIVCMFHADMYMAKGFDIALLKHLKPKTVVSGTRIEPPLHPAGLEKIVMDFGMYPEDFKQMEFDSYVANLIQKNSDLTTKGIFAPWACYRTDIINVNMHDVNFHSYHEDSDIFNRFILSGYNIIQSWEAFVYHLTCRGGQFQDGVEKITNDKAFHQMKVNAARNYLRKWGCWIKNDEYHYPTLSHKYNVAFVVKNCNEQVLEILEPWCDRIYIDNNIGSPITAYIAKEQPHTQYNLTQRVLSVEQTNPVNDNDIVVEFDATRLTQQSLNIIQCLADIITESGDIGEFELDIYKITINTIRPLEDDLIVYNK